MIRICLIGISGFARTHYDEVTRHHALGLSQLVAATVINQAEEVERCAHLRDIGCEIHTDHLAMLAAWKGRADLCIVPTGIHLHAPMAIAAMEAGMDALVEKPAAATVEDVDAMRAAEARTGRRVIMAFQSMYADETLEMKRIIGSGVLGKLKEIVSWSLWARGPEYYARNAWAGRLQVKGTPILDSPFNNAVAHQLHMILFLAGPTETASATVTGVRAELFRAKPIESCDTAGIIASTAEGVPCRFLTTHASPAGENVNPVIEVRGERGTLRWDFHRTVTLTVDGRSRSWAADGQCRERMHAAIRERLGGGSAFLADLGHARAHTLVVNRANDAGIRSIPENLHSEPGVIAGIREDLLRLAASVGTLPSDLGLAWAQQAVAAR